MLVKEFINHPVTSNCFVVYTYGDERCAVIDPGTESDPLLYSFLQKNFLLPQYIILTHHHFDHIWGVACLKQLYPQSQIVCNRECSEMIIDRKKNCSLYYNQEGFVCPPADFILSGNSESLSLCNSILKFSNAPGHSSSSILIEIETDLFTGDTLIKDEKTVLKLPASSRVGMISTLEHLSALKGRGLTVYAGHGPSFELDDYDLEKTL